MCASAHTRLAPELRHFVSAHGDLGYSALLHNIEGYQPASGLNLNLGADYRVFYNDFIFSVGVEGLYELHANHIKALDFSLPMQDTEGELFDMHVQVDKARDLTHMINLNFPILLGGEWKRFYFMVGPKFSINLYGATSSNARFQTYGEYERPYDPFHDMPNHQFESNQHMSSGVMPLKWNFQILAHAEIGARIGKASFFQVFRRHPDLTRMYLAAYVDFGVLNIHTGTNGRPPFEYVETDQGVKFYVQPLMTSSLSNAAVVRNMSVGIKYTIAFELPIEKKSYIYDSNKAGRNYRKRGGNQTLKD